MTNTQAVDAALLVCRIVADAIKELGSVPSGHLYAQLSGHVTLGTYNSIIQILKDGGLVTESNHLLTWVSDQKTS